MIMYDLNDVFWYCVVDVTCDNTFSKNKYKMIVENKSLEFWSPTSENLIVMSEDAVLVPIRKSGNKNQEKRAIRQQTK
jgi:hypothetical protein